MDGYENLNDSKVEEFNDSIYKWEYGTSQKIKTYKIDNNNFKDNSKIVANSINSGFQFKTAESFLNSLNNKKINNETDISKYKEGQRIYHKRFGEGTINKIEEEGDDFKLDISFDKVGNKRLMAKFANLEII